jgi:2-keto-4-pentenoate hydratase/2-oxohepta-3-ene-1,7-dioic acid hydratase in catechol pathway
LKLVTFQIGGGSPRIGALVENGERILDFCAEPLGIPRPETFLECFDLDGAFLTEAKSLYERALAEPGEMTRLRDCAAVLRSEAVKLLAPVPRPGKVLCIGVNYRAHAEEQDETPPERPLLFSKFPTSIIGPGESVRIPPGSEQTDYEAELAVVIGRKGTRISAERAYDYVLGYSNLNDVSARDYQFPDGQWQRGKSCDTFAPFGPYLATADEIPDPHALAIRFRLNGETMQDSDTSKMIHKIPALIAALSESITLEPGDVIATGTPSGVGFARTPPVFLRPGDRMEVEIDELGVLVNSVIGTDD